MFTVILIVLILFKLYQKFTAAKCQFSKKMDCKVVIITGANTGIGFETARDLATRGARVILACRDRTKGIAAQDTIIKDTGNKNVVYKHLDLSSLNSVRNFVEDYKKTETKLDVLINNAGVICEGSHTQDGIVRDMQVNYFSHFLLTILLVPLLKKSESARIINVSSIIHFAGVIDFRNLNKEGHYGYIRRYSNSKLCNVLFTVELAGRLKGSNITVNSLHPGVVYTTMLYSQTYLMSQLTALVFRSFFKNVVEGAQTSVYVAISDLCEKVSGKYFSDCREAWMTCKSKDRELMNKLWNYSVDLVKLKQDEICF